MPLTAALSTALLACGLAIGTYPMLAGGLSATLGPAAWAATATAVPLTQSAFSASQAGGKPILVEIDANWCPTCARQRPVVRQLLSTPEFRDVVAYRVDFDTQKDVTPSPKVSNRVRDLTRISPMADNIAVQLYRICHEYPHVAFVMMVGSWNTQRVNRIMALCGSISATA